MASDIKTVDLTIPLPLRFLGDEKKAIILRLNGLISQYVKEADGVLIKWEDLTIYNDKGIILDDQPYVFWKIGFTAHVFKPIEGKVVRGRVHEVQKCYFIAKAMNSLTVTVSIPENLLDNNIIQDMMIEQDIYFKIKGCAEGAYKGVVDEECLELTSNLKAQEAESGKEAYDYSNDFEY